MSDEIEPTAIAIRDPGVSWRIYEKESFQAYFGDMIEGRPNDPALHFIPTTVKYAYWKPHTEGTSESVWRFMLKVRDQYAKRRIKMINDPVGWLSCHAKEKAFAVWAGNGIPCPDWFYFIDPEDFFQRRRFEYPLLIRLNNSTSGWFSYLVCNDNEAKDCLPTLMSNADYKHDGRDNTGVGRRFIAVQFIPTTRPENVNLSFRIIVAGDRVVTGYARVGPPEDWIAITNRFHKGMEDTFVKYQKVCQEFCEKNEALIVKAVQCLGLNFQGVDVILDQDNKPYFLEVQPGFSVGYANYKAWRPPFYNPSRPPELRQFLIDNLPRLQKEIPMYCLWLDKYKMFDAAFRYLKEQLDGTGNHTTDSDA